ncbi:MAG: hypothetical protein LBB25_02940, partial [Holosporaceae bacterium]|nr:hypothetical protein [Holosporaceae bacterium]
YLLFHEYYSSSTTFKPQNHADALQNNYTAMINLIILIHYIRKKIHEFDQIGWGSGGFEGELKVFSGPL